MLLSWDLVGFIWFYWETEVIRSSCSSSSNIWSYSATSIVSFTWTSSRFLASAVSSANCWAISCFFLMNEAFEKTLFCLEIYDFLSSLAALALPKTELSWDLDFKLLVWLPALDPLIILVSFSLNLAIFYLLRTLLVSFSP